MNPNFPLQQTHVFKGKSLGHCQLLNQIITHLLVYSLPTDSKTVFARSGCPGV